MRSLQTVVARHPDAAWQMVEEKAVVVTSQTKKIHILEGSGGRIWEFLDQPRSLQEITSMICEEYEVGEAEAEKDIQSFVDNLFERLILVEAAA